MAHRAVADSSSAHARTGRRRLPGSSLRRRRSRRLHAGARRRDADREIRHRHRCAGADQHDRRVRPTDRARIPRRHRPGIVAGADGRPRQRCAATSRRCPPHAAAVPPSVRTLTPMSYRGADELADGGVFVVGGRATGVQLADEIHRSGRPVTLATGEHVRLPRTYRGRDIFWWMEPLASSTSATTKSTTSPAHATCRHRNWSARRAPDAGSQRADVPRRARRRASRRHHRRRAHFAGSLANVCALADLKLNRLLDTLDEWARSSGTHDEVDPPHRYEPTRLTLNRHSVSISRAARSARSSGRRATGPTTPGSTCRSSIATAASVTTVASSPRRQACTPSASRSCGAADRRSSTVRSPIPRTSPRICGPSSDS